MSQQEMDQASLFSRELGPVPQEAPSTTPTPWIAKVLGGLQDALAVISHAKNPRSDAEFGGFAHAMFAKSNYNRGVASRNAARIMERQKDLAEMGKAIILRKISAQIANENDATHDTLTEKLFDYVTVGKSPAEKQRIAQELLYGKMKGKGTSTVDERIAQLSVDADGGDEDAKILLDHYMKVKQAQSENKLSTDITKIEARGQQSRLTKGVPGAAQTNQEALTPEQSRRAEMEPLESKRKDAAETLKAAKSDAAAYGFLKDTNTIRLNAEKQAANAQAELASIDAQIQAINKTYKTRGKKPAAPATSGWSVVK